MQHSMGLVQSSVFCSFSVTPSFSVMCFFFQLCTVNLILFIFFIIASSHIALGLPGVFFLWSLLSMTFCNKQSCLKTCPIQFFCHFLRVFSKERLSSTIPNICSFDGVNLGRNHSSQCIRLESECPQLVVMCSLLDLCSHRHSLNWYIKYINIEHCNQNY